MGMEILVMGTPDTGTLVMGMGTPDMERLDMAPQGMVPTMTEGAGRKNSGESNGDLIESVTGSRRNVVVLRKSDAIIRTITAGNHRQISHPLCHRHDAKNAALPDSLPVRINVPQKSVSAVAGICVSQGGLAASVAKASFSVTLSKAADL